MSGVVRGVKKTFKAIGKVVKKVIKPVAIAAAVYFTGGLALSAFPATAGFAASLPGFGISASGAATGIFSKAASTIGLSGGLQAGAAANAATVAGTAAAATAATGGAAAAGAAGAGAAAGTAATGAAAATGMSLTNKLLLASLGTQAVGAFLAPGIDEVAAAQKKWRGAFYGMDGDGSVDQRPQASAAGPVATNAAQQPVASTPVGRQPTEPSRPSVDAPRQLMATDRRATATETPAAPAAPQSSGQPVENAPIQPRRQLMEGVRYVA